MTKNYEVFIIGHISKDEIVFKGAKEELIGGAVIYAGCAAAASGSKIGVLTKVSEQDKGLLDVFNLPKEDIYCVYSSQTTSIRNEYFSEDREKRISTALAVADPFTMEDLPNVAAKIYYFAGLIAGDFQLTMLENLSGQGRIALDAQGILREVEKDGRIVLRDWPLKKKYLPLVDFFKADAVEAEVVTGCSLPHEAARLLHLWGAKEIMITQHGKVLVYDGKSFYSQPLKPRNLSGRTGRGDTCFGSYTARRLRAGIEESLLFASALVSLKMETPGPFRGTTDEVRSYIEQFYN
ncbi:PfkB family carbohydrate kinase [Thermanaeromonas sp. C210]|uniref:PfkB family carbohydrate kinase n=1 Tax=Thermanaeromonas sp. C210 TaxID=2731925 RepID=UPI00155C1B26|nr:PfkB family carbohydrate kinase [Thermanaeromonas sp. C210]GFN24246.1 ribokinase [Thermanaeromonas sp. C210]